MTSRPFTYILYPIAVFFSLIAYGQTIANDGIVASIHRYHQNVGIRSVVPFDGRFLCLDEDEKLFFVDANSSQIDSSINKYSTDYYFEKLQVINNVVVGTEGYQDKFRSYSLDLQKKKWKRYRFKKHIYPGTLIFQDDEYLISNTCSGEWGGTIYFTNKKTSKIYESECTCAVNVIKCPDYYNVTASLLHGVGFTTIFNIRDPTKLKVHRNRIPLYLSDSLKAKGISIRESYSSKGVEKLIDTLEASCAGSFKFNNSILYIIEYRPFLHSSSVWIDSIKNNKLIRLYDLTKLGLSETGYDNFSYNQIVISPFDNTDFSGFICMIYDKLELYIFDRQKK